MHQIYALFQDDSFKNRILCFCCWSFPFCIFVICRNSVYINNSQHNSISYLNGRSYNPTNCFSIMFYIPIFQNISHTHTHTHERNIIEISSWIWIKGLISLNLMLNQVCALYLISEWATFLASFIWFADWLFCQNIVFCLICKTSLHCFFKNIGVVKCASIEVEECRYCFPAFPF